MRFLPELYGPVGVCLPGLFSGKGIVNVGDLCENGGMTEPAITPATDLRKLQGGASAGGGALGLAIMGVWLVNRHMEPPMPAEIAAAASGGLVWLLNNLFVYLTPHR